MKKDLVSACQELDHDKSIKVNISFTLYLTYLFKVIVLLSKVEKAFCAGADIKEFTSITHEHQLHDDIFEGLD